MPILSYASEVWAVDPNIGAGTELLHRQFLKQLLRVRNSTNNQIVLAEFGRYPLQFHYWQQILRFHNRALRMPSEKPRLVQLALVEGAVLQDEGQGSEASAARNWRHSLDAFLSTQPGQPRSFTNLDVSTIVNGLKEGCQSALYADDEHSSLALYKNLQPEYKYAQYLSSVQSFHNRKLISRFRCGCHGLHVDTGRFGQGAQKLAREDRVCQLSCSTSVEDEHHFLFDCPAYMHIRDKHAPLFQAATPSVALFVNNSDSNAVGRYLRKCFIHKESILGSCVGAAALALIHHDIPCNLHASLWTPKTFRIMS